MTEGERAHRLDERREDSSASASLRSDAHYVHVTERAAIARFLAGKRIALVGVSSRTEDFSRALFHELVARGYDVVPVHPGLKEVEGRRAFGRVQDIPGPLDGAILMTPPVATEGVVRDCAEAGVTSLWMHRGVGRGAVSKEAVAFCRARGMSVIPGECPMMFLGGGAHRAHARWRMLVGTYPSGAPSLSRARRALVLAGSGVVGWMLCAGLMGLLLATLPAATAVWVHLAAAPILFGAVSAVYFRTRAPVAPLVAAVSFVAIVALLDGVVVAGALLHSAAMFGSLLSTWIPFLLIFVATILVGGWFQRSASLPPG